MNTPSRQGIELMVMVLCGAAVGAAWDLLAALRRAAFGEKGGRTAQDLLGGAMFAAGVMAAALELRTQAMRGYTIAGALAGTVLYRLTAGEVLRQLWRLVLRLGEKKSGHRGICRRDAGNDR